jgi:protocatechuate 3,4-dioxygenase beta subunit
VNAFSETARSFGYVNTLSDGTFEVRGLSSARDFRLFIQPPSTTGGIVPTFLENIAVAAGQATDVGTINATSADSYLLVTVLEGGSGISSANVHAWRPFTPYFGYCSTNSSGQCNITGLTTGTYDIFVDSAGRPPRFTNATLAAGNNSLAFNYNATGTLYTLNGTVVNSSSGGVANAEVGIWDEATRFGMHTQANGSGFFSFTGVPGSTTYKFGARKPGYLDSLGTVAMEAANKTQNITLNTAAGFLTGGSLITISGTVVSASSASVATKSVVIVDAANASFFNDITVTNSSGQYAFTSVPAQTATITYKLTAVLGNQTFNATQAVTSGQNYTVNITVS